ELIVPVVGRGQQRRPAILGDLVHVGACVEQQLRRLEIAFTSGKHQRRQTAASTAHQTGDDVVGGLIGGVIRRRRGSASPRRPAPRRRAPPCRSCPAPRCRRASAGRRGASPTARGRCGRIAIVINRLTRAKTGTGADKRTRRLLEPDLLFDR